MPQESDDHGGVHENVESGFSEGFRVELRRLFQMRRDVRRFRCDPISDEILSGLVESALTAPSVGLSEPWRLVRVDSKEIRLAVAADFERENAAASLEYSESNRDEYLRLKLAGLESAPIHLAIFADPATPQGKKLGRRTMPETIEYSVVAAIQNFWLAARAVGIGVGWVSILDPERIGHILNVPAEWKLIAYLCVGYPESESDTPELERLGWEKRDRASPLWLTR